VETVCKCQWSIFFDGLLEEGWFDAHFGSFKRWRRRLGFCQVAFVKIPQIADALQTVLEA